MYVLVKGFVPSVDFGCTFNMWPSVSMKNQRMRCYLTVPSDPVALSCHALLVIEFGLFETKSD